jgi:hypothetical protein
MSNPDTRNSAMSDLSVATPTSIFFLLMMIALFIFKDSIPFFNLILWIVFPILGYFICVVVNIINQFVSCKKTDFTKALLGGLPSLGTIFLGIFIASIPYCRIPVASVFTPLIIGSSVDVINNSKNSSNSLKNYNSKECCTPKMTLENIESRYPIIAGLSYGFYIMFSVLFGLTFGNSISSIC